MAKKPPIKNKQANSSLPVGHRLEDYTIIRQLSIGGFSIVYLAEDNEGKLYAIKEYLPSSLALREEGEIEPHISAEHEATFRYGMKCFFEEGRTLARMNHPNVITVVNFFRANGTLYMVMDYMEGHTLHEVVHRYRGYVTERFLRGVFNRVLNGLREVHSNKLLHLDIKPSNIYLRDDSIPILIDFGAARQTLQNDAMLKPMYTPGFASPEHYKDQESFGPWSDVYSIGASMYACIDRKSPQPANDRAVDDQLELAVKKWRGFYTDHFLETIDWCMALDPLERPQSVYSLQKKLIDDDVPPPVKPQPESTSWLSNVVNKIVKK